MATRFAIASGNWSNPAIWDNGTVPTSIDFAYTNGFIIEIDQDIVVGSIQNGASPVYVPNIATPIMTGSNSPSGVASSLNQNGTNAAWYLFDQATAIPYISTTSAFWVQYQFPTSKIIKRYAVLGSANVTLNPKTWTFEGSNDGINWIILHTVNLGTGIPINAWYDSGVFANSTNYLFYRLNITAGGGNNILYMPEWQMTESTSTIIGINTGGNINISSNKTITCTNAAGMLNGSTTVLLTVISNHIITLNTNLRATLGSVLRISGVNHNITINGNVNGSSTTNSIHTINRQAAGILTVTGNIYGGQTSSMGILINDSGTLNVIGDVYSTNFGVNSSAGISITANALVNIIGNVYSALANSSSNFGIIASTASTINIVGNVQGSSLSSTNYGINLTGGATLNITGNVTAGTGVGNNNFAIFSAVNSTININGTVNATAACSAIQSTGVSAINIINGVIKNVQNKMAFFGQNLYIGNATTRWELNKSDNSPRILYSADTLPGVPANTNVRNGTIYGASNELTGTLNVPPIGSVAVGVPVDNTVGTAIISITDMGALLASYNT